MGADCTHVRLPFEQEESTVMVAPMRMLLLSTGLTQRTFFDALDGLLAARREHDGKVSRMVYIPDGSVGRGVDAQVLGQKFERLVKSLSHPCRVKCVELRCQTRETLAAHLRGVDCIFVECGATFYLRHWMRMSGFDELVRPLVMNQGVVYVGASAGGIVSGNTMSIAFWKGWDNPGYGTEWDLSSVGYAGLGLIPGGKSVFPHYHPKFQSLVLTKRDELNHKLIVLDEDHCYLVNGEVECLWPSSASIAPQNWRVGEDDDWAPNSFTPPREKAAELSINTDSIDFFNRLRPRSQSVPQLLDSESMETPRLRGYTWSYQPSRARGVSMTPSPGGSVASAPGGSVAAVGILGGSVASVGSGQCVIPGGSVASVGSGHCVIPGGSVASVGSGHCVIPGGSVASPLGGSVASVGSGHGMKYF